MTEQFTIAAGSPASVVSPGVVGTELENTCTVPPASQDSDGHVSVVGGDGGDGQHAFNVTAGATTVDVDVYMYDENCRQLGSYATASANGVRDHPLRHRLHPDLPVRRCGGGHRPDHHR